MGRRHLIARAAALAAVALGPAAAAARAGWRVLAHGPVNAVVAVLGEFGCVLAAAKASLSKPEPTGTPVSVARS